MKRLKLNESQDGMVSIIVTLIIMAVLSLIVVGFAQLARREQREALDKQLSTQAFYAAESGINDAIKAMDDPNPATRYTSDRTACDASDRFETSGNLTSDGGVGYTCLLIDQSPETLEYSGIETDKSTVVVIKPVDASKNQVTLDTLNISWNTKGGGGSGYYKGATDPLSLPKVGSGAGTWDDREAGILRVDIVPVNASGENREGLIRDTFTVFLYPEGPGSDVPTNIDFEAGSGNEGDQGLIRKVNCGPAKPPFLPRKCKASIKNLMTTNIDHYFLRMTSIYSDSEATISGSYLDGSNTQRPTSFKEAQYVIDSTGKAQDVLKRVRVRVPALNGRYEYPTFAIDSADSICKLMEVYPNGGVDNCPVPTSPATATPAIP